MPAHAESQQRLGSIERLLGKIESEADPSLRATVQELVQAMMDLHGAGLERILELIRASGDGSERLIHKLGQDELVASLLILYELHPEDLETRVMLALDKARVRLSAHEGELELLSLEAGALRLRLHTNGASKGNACGSTAQALKGIVEEAVYHGAPDITELIIIEDVAAKQDFVPLEMLQGAV
jgi:Fe-S cluster biogenesis protein NfuA